KSQLSNCVSEITKIINSSEIAGKNPKIAGTYPIEVGATEIVFYAYDFEDWSNEYMYNIVKEFNSNLEDGIQIKMMVYEDATYVTAIKSAREGGRAPDINMVSYGNLYQDVTKGYNASLAELMGQPAFDDILDNVLDMVTYDGKYYAYPQLVEPSSLLFYNKAMLKSANVTKEPAEWNFSDLLDACAKIKPTLKRNQYTIGLPTGFPLWSTTGLQYNCNGKGVLNDNWDATNMSATINGSSENYNSDNGYANMMRLYWNLYAGGYVPSGNVSPTGYNDIIEALCGEKLAMTFAGSWSVAEIMNTYPSMADNIGIAPIPTADGNKDGVTATNGGWTYAISSTSELDKQQKAATFLKWLLSDNAERTAGFFKAANYSKSAVNKSVNEYIAKDTSVSVNKEWIKVINSVASKSIPEPLYPFDISLKVASLFEWVSINADENKTSTQVDNLFKSQLSNCVSEITKIINSSEIAGKNPKKV
ncbi:MAG: extracellular solute-binding protein, partial [Clostridia bacterium]